MPGITETVLPSHPRHRPQASISPSPPPGSPPPELETTSNVLPDNGPSELFGELASTYHRPLADHKTPPPSAPLPNSRGSPTLNASQSRARTIQIRNRRLHYLTTHHTTYFNPSLELADPLLYDKCIRSFQTASEREAEGKAKGWSGILHADLERAEARMEALKKATEDRRNGTEEEDEDDKVNSKEEGIERWEDAMTRRFLEGGDEDVDYKTIDDNEEYDDVKQIERDVQEAYFDAETPSAPDEGSSCTDTGIQDF